MQQHNLGSLRAQFYIDEYNEKAKELATTFQDVEDDANPNTIFVFGGDGTFLRAVHEYSDKKLPFVGINCGNVGFLLNPIDDVIHFIENGKTLHCYSYPLLVIQPSLYNEQLPIKKAFNDTWIERMNGQCCWFEVFVNGSLRIPKMVCDGVVICTAAGSTGYSHSIGLPPIPIGTQLLCFVPNNVRFPLGLKPVFLPSHTEILIRNIAPNRSKSRGFYDGVNMGEISELKISVSHDECQVGFVQENHTVEKMYVDKVFKPFEK
ncbi:Poly(P)/ATP NAD kinase [Entamoeba marina]